LGGGVTGGYRIELLIGICLIFPTVWKCSLAYGSVFAVFGVMGYEDIYLAVASLFFLATYSEGKLSSLLSAEITKSINFEILLG